MHTEGGGDTAKLSPVPIIPGDICCSGELLAGEEPPKKTIGS